MIWGFTSAQGSDSGPEERYIREGCNGVDQVNENYFVRFIFLFLYI